MNQTSLAMDFIGDSGPLTVDFNGRKITPIYDLGSFYKYDVDTGVWKSVDEFAVFTHIQTMIDRRNQQGLGVNPTFQELEGIRHIATRRCWSLAQDFFATAPKGLTFRNGFLLLNDQNIGELRSHAPENCARSRVEYDYNESPTPRWDELLGKIFAGDHDINERIALIHEFVGAALLGLSTRFGKCIVLFGDGSNGKSSLQAIIKALFHSKLVVTSNPQTWNREYDRAELRGKRLNITSELPEREMMESEAFKAIVEGQEIAARIIREKPFLFHPEAAHLFAANGLMKTSDFSHGFFRRFVVVPFNNIFTGNEDVVSPILKEELGGIALKCVKATEKAIANGYKYTIPISSSIAVDDWKVSANPVAQFVATCLEETTDFTTRAWDIWNAWRAWCKETGFQETNITNFCRRLKQIIGAGSTKRFNDGMYYCYKLSTEGLRIATPFPHAVS